MLGLNNHQYGENIKNIPSDDSYPMISIIKSKKDAMGVNALSLTVLDLINKSQIKCDIGLEGSYEVGKKLTPQDMEVMKKIAAHIGAMDIPNKRKVSSLLMHLPYPTFGH